MASVGQGRKTSWSCCCTYSSLFVLFVKISSCCLIWWIWIDPKCTEAWRMACCGKQQQSFSNMGKPWNFGWQKKRETHCCFNWPEAKSLTCVIKVSSRKIEKKNIGSRAGNRGDSSLFSTVNCKPQLGQLSWISCHQKANYCSFFAGHQHHPSIDGGRTIIIK